MSDRSPQSPPLNATAASLLGFLHLGPMSGWDLSATAERAIGNFWSLTRSQIYRELATLAARGYVLAGEPGRRERRVYRLTDAGRTAFAAWLDQEPGPEQIRYPLLLTIGFGSRLPPARLAEFIRSHRRQHAELLVRYETERQDANLDRYQQATLDFGIRYERAVLDWFEHMPELLDEDVSLADPS